MITQGRLKKLILAVVSASVMALMTAAVCAAAGGIDQASVGKCKECHSKQSDLFFAGNPHAKEWEGRSGGNFSCESCHGSGEKHMRDREPESIFGFSKDSKKTAAEQSAQCLKCHSKTEHLAFWDASKHKKNGVSCADCHKMHKGAEMVKPSSELCMTCHKDIKAQANKRSHHPIIEGKVGCADCHNPHGSLAPKNLKAENVNQLCFKCHADKRGPFVWEHPPVQENCDICHTPHGSVHDKLLIKQSPYLCKECHAVSGHGTNVPLDGSKKFGPDQTFTSTGIPGAPSYNAYRVYGRGCLNCHTRIHGSNGVDKYGQTFIR